MARVIPAGETDKLWSQALHGGHPVYPWEQWFNGETWVLTAGEDFTDTARNPIMSFRRSAYSAADTRGLWVRTRRLNDRHIAIQSLGKRAGGPAAEDGH